MTEDPTCKEFPGRKWGYPIKIIGQKNQGFICFYCMKVYDSRYKLQLKIKVAEAPLMALDRAGRGAGSGADRSAHAHAHA